jgi:hypothetical protein
MRQGRRIAPLSDLAEAHVGQPVALGALVRLTSGTRRGLISVDCDARDLLALNRAIITRLEERIEIVEHDLGQATEDARPIDEVGAIGDGCPAAARR